MKRSSYRNFMLLAVVVIVGISIAIFMKCQQVEQDILARQGDLVRLNQELENVKNISAAQIELDKLTINEQTSTQLDILRHLGLEQSTLTFTLQGREENHVGDTTLFVHSVRIEGVMPYAVALGLCDRLQNAKKIVFTSITMSSAQGKSGDEVSDPSSVSFALEGKIYGLNKQPGMAPVVQAENTP